MNHMRPRWYLTLVGILLLVTGCASGVDNGLALRAAAPPAEALSLAPSLVPGSGGVVAASAQRPRRVAVLRLRDQRPPGGLEARAIGAIKSTVMDMHTSSLALREPVTQALTRLLREQLMLEGFTVQDDAAGADYELSATLSQFRLDVAARDEFVLKVQLGLRESGSGQLVWSGSVEHEADRFAGITGNTRASLTRFLNQETSTWLQKAGAAVGGQWQKFASLVPPASTPPSTVTAPAAPAAPTAPAAPVTPATSSAPTQAKANAGVAAQNQAGPATGYGYFSVISIPTRTQVYSDDIYYGLTPLRVMVPSGVMTFEFRFPGYKTITQKVLIRKDETTELQLQMRK